jgi:hypothetical protein
VQKHCGERSCQLRLRGNYGQSGLAVDSAASAPSSAKSQSSSAGTCSG